MSNFQFLNLEYGTVYPPPLTDDQPPVAPEPESDAPRPSPRRLLASFVLMAIVTGAWLIQYWLGVDMPTVLRRVTAPFDTIVWAFPCAAAWVLLCLLAVVRAARGTR
jgi:hypothetical protein